MWASTSTGATAATLTSYAIVAFVATARRDYGAPYAF